MAEFTGMALATGAIEQVEVSLRVIRDAWLEDDPHGHALVSRAIADIQAVRHALERDAHERWSVAYERERRCGVCGAEHGEPCNDEAHAAEARAEVLHP